MLTRRAVLAPIVLGAASFAARPFPSSGPNTFKHGLGTMAASRGRLYGCATSTYQLRDSDFVRALEREATILVAEYEMKRAALQPEPGDYDFTAADALLHFARAHGMAFRGHTLVWHKANPPWLPDALSTRNENLLTGYIQAVAGHYRGQMHSWDVVNEAIAPGAAGNLRETLWLKAFGPNYIDLAFHAARAADPNALLVYNDQGCEAGGANNDRFRAATLDFLERAKARGVPIDAYGMQGHLQAFGTAVDQRKLRDFLERLKALDLRILITEHDVDDSGGPSDIAVRDRAVADASRRFLDVALDNSAVGAVLTWGLSDRFLDFAGWHAMLKGYTPRMLPLDGAFARKPLWNAIAAAFLSAAPAGRAAGR